MKDTFVNIDQIIQQIMDDPLNQSYTQQGIKPVLQVSSLAKIALIGQAPGSHVQRSLIPFDDASGKTLRSWLGISKEVFYSPEIAIVPMDFYYPGKAKTGDLPPRKEMAKYHASLFEQMPNVQLTILIGQYAQKYYLHDQQSLTNRVLHYQQYLPKYFPIVHPSPLNFRWQKKNPWFLQEVVPALQKQVKSVLK